jgi:hypothetical protein
MHSRGTTHFGGNCPPLDMYGLEPPADTPLPITAETPAMSTWRAFPPFGSRLQDPFHTRFAPGSHPPRLALRIVSGVYSLLSKPCAFD